MTLRTSPQPSLRPINGLASALVLATLVSGPSFAQQSEIPEPTAQPTLDATPVATIEAQAGETATTDGVVALADARTMRSGYQVALKKLRAPSGNIELRQSQSRDAGTTPLPRR